VASSNAATHSGPRAVVKGDAMAAGSTRRTPPPPVLRMELLQASAMRALLDDDLPEARRISQQPLPEFFLTEKWLWEIRVDQVGRSPQDAPWLVRVVVLEPSGVVIGHAGFHGRPDAAGAVEIAYTLVPEHRGNGYAHAVLAALVEEARTHPDVRLVRATVSPDNGPSLAVIRRGGFIHVGEQWDDVDGLELVFEKNLDAARRECSSGTDAREVHGPGHAS
jgi:[ribosomal protein S5]-alanine N-acetyltransferase